MATVIPFTGLRYNPEKIENMAEVVTPPYDVIDATAQERYYQRHLYNIIRLEYGKIHPEDDEINNRYSRAAADFNTWIKENILTPEAKPALYRYEQEFTAKGEKKIRSGFIGGVKLEPYENGVILPHEETLPKHKADRLELMRACKANFSPIFGLYADREKLIDLALSEAANGAPPDVSFTDETGEAHRLWVITDSEVISKVQQAMADKRIFIADGHHRYETALNYQQERQTQAAKQPDGAATAVASSCSATPDGTITYQCTREPAYNYMMMNLVNLYDPGLVVFPTHRLINNVTGLDKARLPEQLKENFNLSEHTLAPDRSNLQALLKLMEEQAGFGAVQASMDAVNGQTMGNAAPHHHIFGMYTGENKFYILSLKHEESLYQIMPQGKSPAWQGLDVAALHSLIIEKHLGIGGELMAKAEHITYTREEESAIAAVDTGEFQLAFFLNPTLVEEVTEVATNGEKMPQKSTFFYPKLITGLVLNQL
ncbi:MAG: hypothetical protein A4E53_04516 [Pelotomaculum sp. PtaB.Bin104]|nr:MAG: hypothetical protein A4E53_04516 [Pelotomaculum sp. PtaB.Bin104]